MSSQVHAVATPGRLSLPARILGILTSPRATFAAVVESPHSWDVVVLTAIVVASLSGILFSTDVGREALLDQEVATLESFGRTVTDAQYAQMRSRLPVMAYAQVGSILAGIPLVTVAIAGGLFGVFNGWLGGRASFAQVMAVVAHAGIVSIVRELVVVPLTYARESLSNPTNLSVFFSMLDDGSFLAAFLGTIDFFVLWWGFLLAMGMAVLYHRKTSAVAVGLFSAYGAIALVIAAIKTALGGQ